MEGFKVEDLREQIVNDIKDQLDFILQNENDITDFSVLGQEIGLDDMEGYMISGYIPIAGATAELRAFWTSPGYEIRP